MSKTNTWKPSGRFMFLIIPNKTKNMTDPLEVMCIDPKATMKDKHIEGGYLKSLNGIAFVSKPIKICNWKPPGRLIIKTKQNKKYI